METAIACGLAGLPLFIYLGVTQGVDRNVAPPSGLNLPAAGTVVAAVVPSQQMGVEK